MKKPIALLISLVVSLSTVNASACRRSALLRTKSLIDAVLNDLVKRHSGLGGSGISSIKFIATDVIKVSLPQEERVDEITYTLTSKTNCEAVILKRKESTRSMGPPRNK